MLASALKCTKCSSEHAVSSKLRACQACGSVLEIDYDLSSVRTVLRKSILRQRGAGLTRFHELLPLDEQTGLVSLGEGATHLHRSLRLGEKLGLRNLYLKDETTNPTGAFIDRGVAIEVTAARKARAHRLVCATTGNLGASLAAYAAKAGLDCVLTAPSRSDLGKIYQMLAFGAEVEACKDYERAVELARTMSSSASLVTPTNPFLLDGQKTLAFEICEQLDWKPPEFVVAPMGNGGLISMISKGFHEFAAIRFIEHDSAGLVGVQLSGTVHGRPSSVPDLSIRRPAMFDYALAAIEKSRGLRLAVTEHETIQAASLLAKTEGIFAEPAAAAAVAGLQKAVKLGRITASDTVVVVITGSGLKNAVASSGFRKANGIAKFFSGGFAAARPARLGTTKSRILSLIGRQESYGYEIWQSLLHEFGLQVKIPTVYQHLSELERLGLIRKSRVQRVSGELVRNYYSLTSSGRQIETAFKKLAS